MANKFLDSTGVKHLWDKIKDTYQLKGNYVTTDTTQTISGTKTYTGNNIFKNNYFEIKASSANDDSWIKLTNATDSGYYAFGIRRPYATYGLQMKYHPASGNDVYYNIWHAGNFTPSNYLTTSAASSTYQPKGDYLTSSSLSGYATQTWVSTQISNLVNSAPEALNTLGELATALQNHEDAYDALLTTVGGKLDKSGGKLTGPTYFDSASGNNKTNNYLSAGGGYSTGSGRLGLKIVALDQSDAQMGMGVDLTGGPYELTVATGRVSDTGASKIVFATHTTGTTAYKTLATLSASTAATPTATFNVNGTIQENGTSLSSKYLGISARAADSAKLGGTAASSYATTSALSNYLPKSGGTITGVLNFQENGTFSPHITHTDVDGETFTLYIPATNSTLATESFVTSKGYLTGITKSMVTTALGYTPPTTDTNTWRPVVNNLTSTATDQSLSAAQGKALNDKFGSYLPKSGGSLYNEATLKFTMYGSRTVTISGNSIDADMSADTGTWAGSFATVKHSKGTTTMLGWYGSKNDGLYSIFMGGSYDNPAMKMDASGNFTFKNTITGTITNANQLGGVAASSYATTSALSNYLPLSGGTLTSLLTLTHDKAQLQFRGGHNSYDGVISYQTSGNEAMVFSTKNVVTSFMFVNGEDTITNVSSTRWKNLTPGLQIKNNKVSIGKLIADGVTPTYNLDVGGTANATTIYENGTTLSNKYQAKGNYLTSHLYRPITVNGTQALVNTSSQTLDLAAGTNISLSYSGGTVTINSTSTGSGDSSLIWSGGSSISSVKSTIHSTAGSYAVIFLEVEIDMDPEGEGDIYYGTLIGTKPYSTSTYTFLTGMVYQYSTASRMQVYGEINASTWYLEADGSDVPYVWVSSISAVGHGG